VNSVKLNFEEITALRNLLVFQMIVLHFSALQILHVDWKSFWNFTALKVRASSRFTHEYTDTGASTNNFDILNSWNSQMDGLFYCLITGITTDW